MTLQSEDMGKLVAGKSVIAKNHNLRTVADVRGNRVWVWGCEGQNHFLVEDIESYTLIGTLTPDGWIEGEWAENPVPGMRVEWRSRAFTGTGDADALSWARGNIMPIIAFRPAHREAQPDPDGGGEIERLLYFAEALREHYNACLDLKVLAHDCETHANDIRTLLMTGWRIVPPPTPEGQTEGAVVPNELIDFLLGEGPMDGLWFGDTKPIMNGKYQAPFWWRDSLRHIRSAALASKGV